MKRSDGSIKKTNEEIRAVIAAANNFAPTLHMDITMFTPPKRTELLLESLESTTNTVIIHEYEYVCIFNYSGIVCHQCNSIATCTLVDNVAQLLSWWHPAYVAA